MHPKSIKNLPKNRPPKLDEPKSIKIDSRAPKSYQKSTPGLHPGGETPMGEHPGAQDCTLAEINPLIVTPDDEVIALDAKVSFDDNGLVRHPELEDLRDPGAETDEDRRARSMGLAFHKLDGTVGCIVNGAGLAMAALDVIEHFGGSAANFLDVGGSSNPEKVRTAMEIILRDPNVRVIMFNIFGGITRCDDVARGLVAVLSSSDVPVPIVVRLTGTNEAEAREIMKQVDVHNATTMDEAIQMAIELAGA